MSDIEKLDKKFVEIYTLTFMHSFNRSNEATVVNKQFIRETSVNET